MKIGISCYPTHGGSGVVATELAMALAQAGDEVHVISYALPFRLSLLGATPGEGAADVPSRIFSNLHYHEVVVPSYPLFDFPPYSLALATKMVEVARNFELDLMHVHYAVPNAVSAVLARQILKPQSLPVVTTLHGTDITLIGYDPNYLETTRYGIAESDAVTTVSDWLRRETIERFSPGVPIDVIPNFIDAERQERAMQQPGARCWAKEGERILVHISNFRPVKRVEDVVAVFAKVLEEMPARLLLVGDGPDRATIEQSCRELGICKQITFLGNLPLVEQVLVGADLFLLPSDHESFGLAALEALACGVPVITTQAGGLPEVIREGEHGHLLPVGDTDGMAAAAIGLLRDEERRQRYASQGQRWATEQFGRDAVVEGYRRVYRRVAGA